MRGNVVGFDPDSNTGAISGHDGRRYDFAMQDWRGQSRPTRGDVVDFSPEGQRAAQIYLIEPEYVPPSLGAFYFSPAGRISRAQYWLRFCVPVLVIGIVLQLAGEQFSVLLSIFNLAILWPGIAILIKRIHDRNKSGWLVWVLYVPLILAIIFTVLTFIVFAFGGGGIAWGLGAAAGVLWASVLVVGIWFFVEFGCMRGTVGANRYGADPVPAR